MRPKSPTIAVIPWGDVWEDFYGTLGISFETFCHEFTGSWQFKLIKALSLVGVEAVSYYSTIGVKEPTRYRHIPTGSTICLLPAPRLYRRVYNKMIHPHHSFGYWGPVEQLFGPGGTLKTTFRQIAKHVSPYLATSLARLTREIKRDGCDAILCQEYEHANFDRAALVGRLSGIPLYAIFQGGGADWNKIGQVLHPLTLKLASGVIIGSSAEITRVCAHYDLRAEDINKLPNPIDPLLWSDSDQSSARKLFGIPPEAAVVAWHGRVEIEAKGLDNLQAAWRKICSERAGIDLRLLLMGAGRDSKVLEAQVARDKSITFISKFTTDPHFLRQFLAAADIYAFPSRHEGLPVAPTEAMACGLPVVAAEASGVRDIFERDEDSGGLIVPFNDAGAFARALGRLIDDPLLRQWMGQRAQERALQFRAERVGEQLKSLLLQRLRPSSEGAASQ
jgi:glycosyltransferase involved in cell wall biosynthesis